MPNVQHANGWVFYDGECALCRNWISRTRSHLIRQGFQFESLQTQWVRERVGLRAGEVPDEMKVVTRAGELFGGIDAVLHLARFIWWARPLIIFSKLPGSIWILRRIYRWLAKRRHCFGSTCRLPQ